MDCRRCIYAEWDYEEYSNCRDKQWFVSGCVKDCDPDGSEECKEYEDIYESTL